MDVTGYSHKYAIGLLNQAPEGKLTIQRSRLPQYGPQVQQALLLTCKEVKRICAKHLISFCFLPLLRLLSHGPLHMTQENRSHPFSMRVTIVERILCC